MATAYYVLTGHIEEPSVFQTEALSIQFSETWSQAGEDKRQTYGSLQYLSLERLRQHSHVIAGTTDNVRTDLHVHTVRDSNSWMLWSDDKWRSDMQKCAFRVFKGFCRSDISTVSHIPPSSPDFLLLISSPPEEVTDENQVKLDY
jgi:hypothetical protein